MKNKTFEHIFDIIHFNSQKVENYFNSLEVLKKGLCVEFDKEENTDNVVKIQNWIKSNIAISNSYFYGEFASFNFCIHSKSIIQLEINSDSSNLYFEEIEFDNINIVLNNDTLIREKLKNLPYFNMVIRLQKSSIFQENFNFLLKKQSSNIPDFYKKHIISEILSEYDLKKKYISFIENQDINFNDSLSVIYSISDNLELKSKIQDFKEKKDILIILSALKRNYWDNSNI